MRKFSYTPWSINNKTQNMTIDNETKQLNAEPELERTKLKTENNVEPVSSSSSESSNKDENDSDSSSNSESNGEENKVPKVENEVKKPLLSDFPIQGSEMCKSEVERYIDKWILTFWNVGL